MAMDQEAVAERVESLRHRIDDIAEHVANGTYDELSSPMHRLTRTWRERPWLIILAGVGAIVTVALIITLILRIVRNNRD